MKTEPRRQEADIDFATSDGPTTIPFRPELKGEPKLRNDHRTVTLYLREIGQLEQLTPQEENDLVAQVKRGNRKARQRLIKAGLRRVVEISREYVDLGLPLLDLISEGNLGLLNAIKRFDPAEMNQFASYSTWWIKQSIKRALVQQSRTISLDQYLQQSRVVPAKPDGLFAEAYPFIRGHSGSCDDSLENVAARGA